MLPTDIILLRTRFCPSPATPRPGTPPSPPPTQTHPSPPPTQTHPLPHPHPHFFFFFFFFFKSSSTQSNLKENACGFKQNPWNSTLQTAAVKSNKGPRISYSFAWSKTQTGLSMHMKCISCRIIVPFSPYVFVRTWYWHPMGNEWGGGGGGGGSSTLRMLQTLAFPNEPFRLER